MAGDTGAVVKGDASPAAAGQQERVTGTFAGILVGAGTREVAPG